MDDRLLDAFDQINLTYHDSLGGDRHAYMIEVAQTPVAGILSSNDVLGCTVDADGDTFQMSLALLDSVGYDSLYPAWEEHYAESAKVRSFWFSAEANSNGWRWQGIVYQDNQGNEYLRYFDSLTSSNSSKFASGTFTLQSRYLDGYYWDQRYMLDAQTGGFIKMQPPIESFTLFDFDWPYQPYGEYHDIEDHMEQHQGKWTGYIDLASDTTKLIVEPEIHVQLDIKNTTAVLSFTEAGNSFSGETFHFDCDPVWEALRMRRTDSVELAAEQVQNILWITFYYYHAHDFDLDTHFIVDDLAPDGDASKSVLYGVVFNEEKQEIARITLSKHSTSTEELSERNTNDLSIK